MLRLLLATIAVSLAASGARATDDYVPCNETIRFCDGQRAALTRAIYGLEPIQQRGPDAVRVIYADDYRRPMPAIVVERTAGGGALLRLIMLRNPPLLGHSQAEPFKRVAGRRRLHGHGPINSSPRPRWPSTPPKSCPSRSRRIRTRSRSASIRAARRSKCGSMGAGSYASAILAMTMN